MKPKKPFCKIIAISALLIVCVLILPRVYQKLLEARAARLYHLAAAQIDAVEACHRKFLSHPEELDDRCLDLIKRKRKDLLFKDIQNPAVFWHQQLSYLGAITTKYSNTPLVPRAKLLTSRIFCLWNRMGIPEADSFLAAMVENYNAARTQESSLPSAELAFVRSCMEEIVR
ncbi:MAG: hypothetical protein HY391_04150 [Deltaproteobacteria bacterium]|nr:hypothetical protein [Deltaproteobacteria bacterium]